MDNRQRFIKKIKSKKGESMVEAMVASLIVFLTLTMLAGGIVTSAKVNKAAQDLNAEFKIISEDNVAAPVDDNSYHVVIQRLDGSSKIVNGVTIYHTGRILNGETVYDGYYFYQETTD